MVDIVDEQRAINRVALAHIEPAEEQRLRNAQKQHPLTWQSQRPVVQVLQSGQANLFSHIDCANPQASGAAFEAPDLVYETGICSVMIVPLKARGAIVGAMTLGSLRQHRHYETHDLVLAEDLAHRAALAVDNARLYGDAQLARAEANALAGRSTFLAEVSRILTTSFNHERTLYEVAHLSVPFLADWCIIDVVQDDNQLQRTEAADNNIRRLAGDKHTPSSPATPALVATPPLLARVLETGRSEFYPELPAALLEGLASSAEHLRLLHTVQPQSAIIVPLIAQQRNLGTITCFAFTNGHHYQLGDLTLAEDLAHRVALAIDNARLYFEVQEAVRIRDQFFSIASHELKTPLTSLMGYSRLLQSLAQRDNLTEREQRGIRIITEQTDRLSRLINALLDISRIRMGRLSIEQTAVDIAALTQRVVEEVQVMLEQHTLTLELPAQPLIVDGDMLRLEQVLQNLIQNAIKYSPEGGSIEVRLEQQDDHASIAVSDHGIGIAPEALSEMFQPFYRAPNAATQQIVGMGIGLYVVKEIVTLHGGEVDVESQEGAGSTFTVRLPLAPVAAPLPTAPSAP
jgi:signal transduction histidine kinase